MKQCITKEQWFELEIGQSVKLVEFFSGTMSSDYPLTIGQMIEFLGDDWADNQIKEIKGEPYFGIKNEDFCDELWELVKNKLNNKL